MITCIHCSCVISGTKFSPRLARELSGIEFTEPIEPMNIGDRGRYKGKPDPCGSGVINFPLYTNNEEAFVILKRLAAARHILDSLEADLTVYMTFGYRDQCNLELTPEMLASLAELQCPVGISCFEDEEDDR